MTGDDQAYAVCGGGTGGHIFPALAVAQALRREEPGARVHYFGKAEGMERQLVAKQQIPFEGLEVSGFSRAFTARNLRSLWQAGQGWRQARRRLPALKIRAVLGTGGYVSGPVVLAAASLGIPSIIHESNSVPGLTNRMLGVWATRVCVSHPLAANYFSARKVMVTGFPLREGLDTPTREDGCRAFGLDPQRRVLFVFPGSLAARRINLAVAELLPELQHRVPDLQLIWMSGEKDLPLARQACEKSQTPVSLHAFILDVPKAYAAADLVLARAGAGTVAELSATGKASLLVPYPHATANHQARNAEVLRKVGAAEVMPDAEVDGARLLGRLEKTLRRIEYMRECAAVLSADYPKQAAQALARLLLKYGRMPGGLNAG